jgi:hypothetical protein
LLFHCPDRDLEKFWHSGCILLVDEANDGNARLSREFKLHSRQENEGDNQFSW